MVDSGRGTDKLNFHYRALPHWDKDGKITYIKKPAIEITFRKYSEKKDADNRELRLNALIDSGADRSFYQKKFLMCCVWTYRLRIRES